MTLLKQFKSDTVNIELTLNKSPTKEFIVTSEAEVDDGVFSTHSYKFETLEQGLNCMLDIVIMMADILNKRPTR